MTEAYASRTQTKMKEVLMKPDADGPEIYYYMMRGGVTKKNITVWETGTVAGEYIKTYGHYHVDSSTKETYTILAGQGILLLQTRQKDPAGNFIDNKIADFKALKVKAGDIIAIPPFAGHAMANTGSTWLVTSDDSPFNTADAVKNIQDSSSMPEHADYEPIKKMHGFAYYVVEKNGEPTLVKNQNYSSIPDAYIT
jgi:glucose-6-phosphate isomerase, archaeal